MSSDEIIRMECLGKLDVGIRSHRQERYNLELALEVAPRNSRYSSNLVNLMQREEVSLREGRPCQELSREVESCLATETRSFFARVSQSSVKRWGFLQQKVHQEKQELIQLVRDKARMLMSDAIGNEQSCKDVTPIDLEIESMRLEAEYNRNWQDIEMFHINEAFKSQKNRIDVEWGTHLDSLNEAYDKKMRSICNTEHEFASRSSKSSAVNVEGRWHHAEKQKTLIHTAPVLSPSTNGMAVGSGVRAVRKKGKENSSNRAEIERVERQHKSMVNSLMAQKANAVRWMRHQETRLVSQVQETSCSRVPITYLLESELALLRDFRTLMNSQHTAGGRRP